MPCRCGAPTECPKRNGLRVHQVRAGLSGPLEGEQRPPRRSGRSDRLRASETFFARQAKRARERAGGVCEVCLHEPDVLTHHRIPRGFGGSSRNPQIHRLSALLRVGAVCNTLIEIEQRGEAYVKGWLVHRGDDTAQIPVTVGMEPFTRCVLLDDDGGKVEL